VENGSTVAARLQDPMTSLVLENREKYIAALQAIFQYVTFFFIGIS
jgi:hypothetical protein